MEEQTGEGDGGVEGWRGAGVGRRSRSRGVCFIFNGSSFAAALAGHCGNADAHPDRRWLDKAGHLIGWLARWACGSVGGTVAK